MSDTTNTRLCQSAATATLTCKQCGLRLPADNFYLRPHGNTPDSYCKECRKAANRLRRKKKVQPDSPTDTQRGYIVITRVEQREQRLQLILQALRVVRESVTRHRQKAHEEEFKQEED